MWRWHKPHTTHKPRPRPATATASSGGETSGQHRRGQGATSGGVDGGGGVDDGGGVVDGGRPSRGAGREEIAGTHGSSGFVHGSRRRALSYDEKTEGEVAREV